MPEVESIINVHWSALFALLYELECTEYTGGGTNVYCPLYRTIPEVECTALPP